MPFDPDPATSDIGTQHPATGPFAPLTPERWPDAAFPLGARYTERSTSFAVYAEHAERVLLEIYETATGEGARYDYFMARGADGIWFAELAEVPLGTLYGFRCWGPNFAWDPAWRRGGSLAGCRADVDTEGNRYNPNKLLFDPYARELSHDPVYPAFAAAGHEVTIYASGPGLYQQPTGDAKPRRWFDTGHYAPKAVVVHDTTSFGIKPRLPAADAIVYEAHVRGITRHSSSGRLADILAGIPGFEAVASVPAELRGTYRGAAMMAPYLRALGYTTIELLPVHEFSNAIIPEEPPDTDVAALRGNYWGYMTLGYFAPDRRYSRDRTFGGPTREFKAMIRAFHDAGLEVYLDVVYNHTGEGGLYAHPERSGELDPDTAEILAFRGLDNVGYYALCDDPRQYWVSTGCGNNLDCSRPAVRRLVLDSLEYWCREMGVDGFRFDLATVLGRDAVIDYRFTGGADLLKAIARLAAVEDIEVIAEAWDCQYPAGYQVGNFPPGWAEWNGNFRDVLRRFVKGDPGQAIAFAGVVNGDYSHFVDQGGPHKSITFLVAHDGFTLADLVSYNGKNNGADWPFGPSDGGADDNLSWDSGGSHPLRRERLRSFFALQMFARGVPMNVYGDEFARTQNGNNNPWSLDTVATWSNYDMIATNAPQRVRTGHVGAAYHDNYGVDEGTGGKNAFFLFVRHLLGVRNRYGCLRQSVFGDLALGGAGNVTFLFAGPDASSPLDPADRALEWWIDGSAIGEDDFLLLVNMEHQARNFRVPPPRGARQWRRIVDTARWAEPLGNTWNPEEGTAIPAEARYGVHPYTVVVLQAVRDACR